VYDALQAGFAYRPDSLDMSPRGDDEGSLPGVIGYADPGLALVDERAGLYQALSTLPEREAVAVVMRFFGSLTQTQIGERLGMSQMQVSRLLSRALATLRQRLSEAPEPEPPARHGTPAMAHEAG
jgi:RNA polymerase sigma-B factor